MISLERSLNVELRILTKPFTKNVSKDGEWLQTLGRSNHEEERKNLVEDLVKITLKSCLVQNFIILH